MKKIKNILILAGGDSNRFWPLKRKSYFPFLGKSLLFHQLNTLKDFAEIIVIIVNKFDLDIAKTTVSQIINKEKYRFRITSQNPNLKGQSGAILSAKNNIRGDVLILNAEDIFNHEILNKCIDTSIHSTIDCLLVAKKVKAYFPGGYLKFKDNKLREIIEKPKPNFVPSDKVRLVMDYFKDFDRLIHTLEITETNKDDLYENAINQLLKQNLKAEYLLYDDYWYVLKYPWHVLPMMQYFLKTLKNEIKIGKNVQIAKTAKIVGPCFIDDNTVIGDFVMIRQSHIGKNCVIGGYSEITRSYVGDNVSLHRNFVGDSVLDKNVSFGAQAATANFRFDEKPVQSRVNGIKINTNLVKFGAIIGFGSKIGVNSTLLPGLKIGKNTFIGPGETIYDDIEDNSFVFKGKKTKNTT